MEIIIQMNSLQNYYCKFIFNAVIIPCYRVSKYSNQFFISSM